MKTRLLSLHHAERSGIVSCLAPILKKYKQAVNGFEDDWMKMDKDRAEALVTWVNCCVADTGQSIASLAELCPQSNKDNASCLLHILKLIDPDLSLEAPTTHEQIFSFVKSSLEGFCSQNLAAVLSVDAALSGDDLEIAKFVTLLLWSAIQCNNGQLFINKILKMSDETQCHFKFLMEVVLDEMHSGGLGHKFGTLLTQRAVTIDRAVLEDAPVSSPGAVGTSSPVEFSSSPFCSLLASPQVKINRHQFVVGKLNQKVKRLQLSLETQAHIQSELEQELSDKNKQLETKDSKIRDQNKNVQELLDEIDKLEGFRHYKLDLEKSKEDNERLKHKLEKMESFNKERGDWEKDMASFLEKKAQVELQAKETDQLRLSCERYKTQMHKLEFQASELAASLKRRDAQIEELANQRDEAQRSFQEASEMWQELRETRRKESALDEPTCGEAMIAVNQDGRILALEFENTRIKEELAAAPDQQELQALKEKLEIAQRSKESYEKNFVDAKCQLLEYENELSQLSSQSRAREEALLKLAAAEAEADQKWKALQQQTEKQQREMEERLMSERAGFKLKIRALTQDLQAAKEAKDKLKDDYDQTLQKNAMAAEDRDKVESELTAAARSLDAQLRAATEENESAAKALEDERTRHAAKMKATEDSLEREVLDKKRAIQEGERVANELQEKDAMLAELVRSSALLSSELKSSKEDFVRERRKVIEERDHVQGELLKKEALLAEVSGASALLKGELAGVKEELKRTTRERELAGEGREAAKRQMQDMEGRLVELSHVNQDLSGEVRLAKESLENEKLERNKALEGQELVKGQLDLKEAALAEIRGWNAGLNDELELVKKDLENEKEAVNCAQTERDQLRDAYEGMLAALRAEFDTERAKAKTSWEEIQKLSGQNREREASLTAEIEALKTRLQEEGEKVEEMEEALEIVREEKEKGSEELQNVKQESESRVQLLEQKIAELEQERDEIEELKGALVTVQDEREDLAKRVQAAEGGQVSLQQQLVEEELINRSVATKLRSAEAQLAQADRVIREKKQELDGLKSSTKENLERELLEKKRAIQEGERVANELQEKDAMLAELVRSSALLSSELKSSKEDFEREVNERRKVIEERDHVQGELLKKEALLAEVSGASALLKGELVGVKEVLKRTTRERELAGEERDAAKRQLQDMEGRLVELSHGNQDLSGEVRLAKESLENEKLERNKALEGQELVRGQLDQKEAALAEIRGWNAGLNDELKLVKEELENEKEAVNCAQTERDQLRDAYEEMLAALRAEFDTELAKAKANCEEVQKLSEESREREASLTAEIEALKTRLQEEGEKVAEMEKALEIVREEKEKGSEELQNVKQESESRVHVLGQKIAELEQERDEIEELKGALVTVQDEREDLAKRVEVAEGSQANLEQQLVEEELINRRVATELRSLEAQLAQADRVIREQKQELEGLKNSRELSSRADHGRRNPGDCRTKPGVKEKQLDTSAASSEGIGSESEDTRLKVEDLNISTSSRLSAAAPDDSAGQLSRFGSSVISTSSRASMRGGVQTRRQSAVYLRGKTPPEMRTTSSRAFFISDQFTMRTEDENDCDYDWNRLSELKRRNASRPPHLKASYALEMQLRKPDSIDDEDAVKTGASSDSPRSYTRKRKALGNSLDAAITRSLSTRSSQSTNTLRGDTKLPSSKSDNSIVSGKRRKDGPANVGSSSRSKSREACEENVPPERVAASVEQRPGGVSFAIMDEAPKDIPAKPSLGKRRVFTRSLGSSKLINKSAKEECKKVLQKEKGLRISSKKPLRPKRVKK